MKKALPVILILICFAAFAVGLAELFALRLDAGDVYPPYSSLRADPLGTMAIYESLQKIPGFTVTRDYSTENRLPERNDTTYLHLAANRYEWEWMDLDTAREIDDFVTRGGRLAITFYPQYNEDFWHKYDDDSETNKAEAKPAKADSKKSTVHHPANKKHKRRDEDEDSLAKRWGVSIGLDSLLPGDHGSYKPAVVKLTTDLPLPETLNWHSALVFTNLDNRWHMIYARHKEAVVIERKFGKGTIVMASDSYFLSNEALWKDRQPGLLSWLIGPNPNVMFDEAHLGITENPGVATLMRKYRLHGLMAALLILAGLFIWKNSVSLVPPQPDDRQRPFVAGKDTAAGFVNLLRRNVPPRDILNMCFTEWKKSVPQASPTAKRRLAEAQTLVNAQAALSQRERTPVATYRHINEILSSSHLKKSEPVTKI